MTRHTRSARAAWAFVAAAALTLGAGALPAQAASPTQILVSSDGVTFTDEISSALFANVGVLVPQDVATVSFWVRNPATVPAQMRVSIKDLVTPSLEMASTVMLTSVDVQTGGTESSTIADLASCDVIVSRGRSPLVRRCGST